MRYEEIVEKIMEATGKSKEEVWEMIEKKRAEMDYLISEEGAAHILASELGIDLTPKMKVSELEEGMRGVNLVVKVLKVFGKREWERNGRKGKVLNLLAADETGRVLVSLWDENADVAVEEGDVLKILGGYVVAGRVLKEVRVGRRARIVVNPAGYESMKVPEAAVEGYVEKTLAEVNEGEKVKVKAAIIKVFERGVKKDAPIFLSFVLDDGTAALRAVAFEDTVAKLLGMSKEEVLETYEMGGFAAIKARVPLLKDFIWYCRVQKNEMRDELELIVRRFERISPIEELERILYS